VQHTSRAAAGFVSGVSCDGKRDVDLRCEIEQLRVELVLCEVETRRSSHLNEPREAWGTDGKIMKFGG